MPSSSEAQRKFMGAVYGYKKGTTADVTDKVKDAAKSMSSGQVKDFLHTEGTDTREDLYKQYNLSKYKGDTFKYHRLRIALDTLAMNPSLSQVMGGPNTEQAKKIVRDITGKEFGETVKEAQWDSPEAEFQRLHKGILRKAKEKGLKPGTKEWDDFVQGEHDAHREWQHNISSAQSGGGPINFEEATMNESLTCPSCLGAIEPGDIQHDICPHCQTQLDRFLKNDFKPAKIKESTGLNVSTNLSLISLIPERLQKKEQKMSGQPCEDC